MDEGQILRPIQNGAVTLGLVLADSDDEALSATSTYSYPVPPHLPGLEKYAGLTY